jgi:hypothetical protein
MVTQPDIEAFALDIVQIEQFAPGDLSPMDKARRAAYVALEQGKNE